MLYDPDANIISMELSSGQIAWAKDFGNFIIHFSKINKPILLEILEADKFAKQFDKEKFSKKLEQAIASN